MFFALFVAITIFIVLITVWVVRRVRENYGIKKDLARSAVFLFVVIFQSMAMSVVGLSIFRFSLAFFLNCVVFNMVTLKVVKSYSAEKVRLNELRKHNLRNKHYGASCNVYANAVLFMYFLVFSDPFMCAPALFWLRDSNF